MNEIKAGNIGVTQEGCKFKVCGRSSYSGYWVIEFLDEPYHMRDATTYMIKKGQIKNPFHPSVYGKGYMGDGPYKGSHTIDGVQIKTPEYEAWRGMMKRCYCPKNQERQPSYIGCTVHPDWHNFQTFAKWYTEQPGYAEGWDLDKDLLVEGNKVYGPDTCILLPRQINSLVTMVDMLDDRFLPRGVYIRQNGTYRVELGSLATKRSTVTVKTVEEAIKLRNQNTIERIGEIVDVYSDKIPEHVMSIIKKRLYKLLWIPSEEDSASN